METASNNIWVVAYDGETNERVAFTSCQPGNALFYQVKHELEGLRVETVPNKDIDAYTAEKKAAGHKSFT